MRSLTPELLSQIYGQTSNDPFLMLVTITYNSTPIRLVANSADVVSNGNTYTAFPVTAVLPIDDGESDRSVAMTFSNVDLSLIDEIRSATNPLPVQIDMVLASDPDTIQLSITDLKIRNVNYNASQITAQLYLDDTLNTEVPSEKYTPSTHPGIF